MDQHAAIPQHGVEAEAVGRGDRQEVEGARDHREDEQEKAEDQGKDCSRIGGDARADSRARDERRAPQRAEDERPVEQRPLLPAVEPGGHQRSRGRQVGVLDHVGE